MSEEWKDIIGLKGKYQVSSFGRIKSMAHTRRYTRENGTRVSYNIPSKIMKLNPDTGGYLVVGVSKNGSRETHTVHRFVAIAFLPTKPGKTCVNHKNGIKHDNRLENLEWVSYKENRDHAVSIGLFDNARVAWSDRFTGENGINAKLKNSQVLEMRELRSQGTPLRDLAKKFNISESNAGHICSRKSWKHL